MVLWSVGDGVMGSLFFPSFLLAPSFAFSMLLEASTKLKMVGPLEFVLIGDPGSWPF